MPSLHAATLDQIVDELSSREDLRFALVAPTSEPGEEGRIRTVSSAGYLDGSRLLAVGAHDHLESLHDAGPVEAKRGGGGAAGPEQN
jgi:hypothetical protein